MSVSAITAVKRFGLGQTRGQINQIAQDPINYVLGQLERPENLQINANLTSSAEVWQKNWQFVAKRRKARKQGNMAAAKAFPRPKYYKQEIFAHIDHAVHTSTPFLERLSWFWTNHFCISASKGPIVRYLSGSYAREAIRPHVLGNFRDMLHAAIGHPAMLIYLDNIKSFGPNSPAGLRRNKGLNENLAREILELHTLGVNGGYSQGDVINFARALTGWGLGWIKSPNPGHFRFNRQIHEPGSVKILGKSYHQRGQNQAEAILDDLARHPSTAKFIARKMAVHFVGDDAPQSLINKLRKTFTNTGGDLHAMAQTLAQAPESWQHPPTKFLPPLDSMVAVARALQISPQEKLIRRTLSVFGQRMWSPPSPAGWPDGDNAWASGDALLERLDWAYRVSALIPAEIRRDIPRFAKDLFGDSLSRDTALAIQQAPTRKDAFSLLVLSPEFQRR